MLKHQHPVESALCAEDYQSALKFGGGTLVQPVQESPQKRKMGGSNNGFSGQKVGELRTPLKKIGGEIPTYNGSSSKKSPLMLATSMFISPSKQS